MNERRKVACTLLCTFKVPNCVMEVCLFLQMHKIADKYIFHCQHGRKECIGNLIAVCQCFVLTIKDNLCLLI